MRIYLVGLTIPSLLAFKAMFRDEKVNVLLSFGRRDQDKYGFFKTHRSKVNSIMLDSGAYTLTWAERKPAGVTVEDYTEYASYNSRYVDFLFNLDSDFSVNGHYNDRINYRNQVILEAAGIDPVPVIHDIDGSEVRDYINRGRHRMLAIGSSLLGNQTGVEIAVNKIHEAEILVHLLGTSSFRLLANNPVSSCDASTWGRDASLGYILFWNPSRFGRSKTDHIQFGEYEGRLPGRYVRFHDYEFLDDLVVHLRDTFGFALSDLMGPSGLVHRQIVNIHYFVELEKRINAEHMKKGFFPNPGATLM